MVSELLKCTRPQTCLCTATIQHLKHGFQINSWIRLSQYIHKKILMSNYWTKLNKKLVTLPIKTFQYQSFHDTKNIIQNWHIKDHKLHGQNAILLFSRLSIKTLMLYIGVQNDMSKCWFVELKYEVTLSCLVVEWISSISRQAIRNNGHIQPRK